MSTIAKVFVVLNLVLSVAFLGAAATFLGYVDSYRGKFDVEAAAHKNTRETSRAALDAKDKEIDDLKAQVTTAQGERTTAQAAEMRVARAYDELKTGFDSLSASLTRMSASLTVATEHIRGLSGLRDELQKNAEIINANLRAAQEERGAAVKSMNQAQLDLENARAQIKELDEKLATAEEARQRCEFQIQSINRGGAPTLPGGEPQPAQTAKITASDPRSNIVVISIGSEDGVKVGYRYIVSRGSAYVATIEITSTEAKLSAGRSIRDLQKSNPAVGDDVSSR